jgi:hypothetical protein
LVIEIGIGLFPAVRDCTAALLEITDDEPPKDDEGG